jgi:hypothetical protein
LCSFPVWRGAELALFYIMNTMRANLLYAQVQDIHLVRDEATGKSRGFCFLKYEDARSCVLAVDNLTGSKVRANSFYSSGKYNVDASVFSQTVN